MGFIGAEGVEPLDSGYYLWDYVPSLPAAIAFTALFSIIISLHLFRMFKNRLWFMVPFCIGGFFEVAGYILRALAHDNTGKLVFYAVQSFVLLVAPALFAASIYMTLGRLVRSLKGEAFSFISPRWMTRLFVTGDILSFAVQGGGAGIMTSGGDNAKSGEKIILGGLWVQIIIFGLFAATAIVFHIRFARHSPVASAYHPGGRSGMSLDWRAVLYVLYAMSVLIMVRSVFRVVEYSGGSEGYLLRHEWTLYVFDAALMWITMVLFFWKYPAEIKLRGKGEGSFEELGLSDDMEQARK